MASYSCRCCFGWSSLSYAHCSVCHTTFATVTLFDNHRHGGACHDLDGIYGVDGIWDTKEGHENARRKREALSKARKAKSKGGGV